MAHCKGSVRLPAIVYFPESCSSLVQKCIMYSEVLPGQVTCCTQAKLPQRWSSRKKGVPEGRRWPRWRLIQAEYPNGLGDKSIDTLIPCSACYAEQGVAGEDHRGVPFGDYEFQTMTCEPSGSSSSSLCQPCLYWKRSMILSPDD